MTNYGEPVVLIEFEWNEDKARENVRKHGVSFEQATQAFRDPLGVEWIDDSEVYGEERLILLGLASNGLLMVVHTGRSHSDEYPTHQIDFSAVSDTR